MLLLLEVACQKSPGSSRPRTPQAPATPQPAKIDWTMMRDSGGKSLRIEYRVANLTDKRMYLSDIMHESSNGKRTLSSPQTIAIINDTEPGVVCFARGRVDFRSPTFMPIYDPESRAIEPGQAVSGDATVPLPLVAQHYGAAGSVEPLDGKPTGRSCSLDISVPNQSG